MADKNTATKQQLAAIMHEKGDVLVSASAGSGKTYVMIQRLIRLITEQGADIDGVLAVTFTNLAAAEMKEKLVRAVTEKINDPDTSPEQRTWLKEQLARIPSASVCTFHSFCNDLIKSNFFELGLDASFKIGDEAQCGMLKGRAIDGLFEELYDSPTEDFRSLLSVLVRRRSDAELKKAVVTISKEFSSEAYPQAAYDGALELYGEGFEKVKAAFIAYYRGFFNNLRAEVLQLSDALDAAGHGGSREYLENLSAYCRQIASATSPCQMAELCHGADGEALPRMSSKGDDELTALNDRRKYLKKKFCDEVKYIRETFDGKTDQILREEMVNAGAVAKGLIDLCRAFDLKYAELKREENVVDFSDLEHFALQLLDNEDICLTVRNKFKYVFADEYQDTNGVQEEILSRITCENTFMVGDVKQSIYGFRGCNPMIFENKRKRFASGEGEAMELSANFRSSTAVLNAVNKIFSCIMTEETCGTDYSVAPMTGGNGELGVCELHLVPPATRKKKGDSTEIKGVYSVKANLAGGKEDKIYREGLLIERLIQDNLSKEIVRADGSKYMVRYGDIVILCRSMKSKNVHRLAALLCDADIPVACEVEKDITVYPEIRMLISLLNLIDCARQDVPLCSVMRGPIGGFTDQELSAIRKFSLENADGKRDERDFFTATEFYAKANSDGLSEKINEFFDYLDKLRFLSDFISCGELLSKAVRDKDLLLVYGARPNGRSRTERINSFILKCGSGEGALTVKQVLERNRRDGDWLKIAEGGSEDAVKIMTVHASKGLEFPVVIVCGLATKFNETSVTEEIIFSRSCGIDGRCAVSVKTYDAEARTKRTNLLAEYIKKRYRSEAAKENMRLLYVALTRAKSRLYLTLTADSLPESISPFDLFAATSYQGYLPSTALPVIDHTAEELEADLKENSQRHLLAGAEDEKLKQKMIKNLSFEYPYNTKTKAKTNVTEALNESPAEGEAPPTEVLFEEYSNEWADESGEVYQTDCGGKASRELARKTGNAYHRFMELVDFEKNSKQQLYEQRERFLLSGLMTEEEAGFVNVDKICRLLSDGFFRMDGAKYYRELPFEVLVPSKILYGVEGDDVLVQGVIDLLAVTDDGTYIADYKVSGKSAVNLRERYQKQVELYAYAASVILNKPVLGKTLYNLSRGEKIKID